MYGNHVLANILHITFINLIPV